MLIYRSIPARVLIGLTNKEKVFMYDSCPTNFEDFQNKTFIMK
jgi:hypothetical protein